MSKYLPLNLFIRQALLYPLTFPFLPPVDKVEKDHKYAAGRLIGTLEAPPATGLPFTGQTVIHTPDDDGDYQKGHTLTRPIVKGAVGNTRFVDNGDGTITDLATGLMWIKDLVNDVGAPFNADKNWLDAIANCEALVFAGHNDWRMPNVKEMVSIMDYGATAPAMDAIFLNVALAWYWTSTTYFPLDTRAWQLDINSGDTSKTVLKTTPGARVFPVRLGLP